MEKSFTTIQKYIFFFFRFFFWLPFWRGLVNQPTVRNLVRSCEIILCFSCKNLKKKKKKLRIVVALVAPASQWGEVVRISSNKLNVFGGLFFFFRHFFFLICHLLQNAISLVIFSIFVLLRAGYVDIWLTFAIGSMNSETANNWLKDFGELDGDSPIGALPILPLHTMSCVTCCVTTQGRMNERYVIRHVESALRVFVLDLVRCWTSFFFKRKKKKMKHRFSFSYLSAF